MKYSKIMMLAVLATVSASFAQADSTSQIDAKVLKAREGLAWQSYKAAETLAEALKAGAICGTNVSYSETLDYLATALSVKGSYRKKAAASKLFNEVFKGNLAYAILISGWSVYSQNTAELFTLMSKGVTLYAPPQGALGVTEQLVFGADGKVTRRNLTMEDNLTWTETVGSFNLVVLDTENLQDTVVFLNLNFEEKDQDGNAVEGRSSYRMSFSPGEVRLLEKDAPADRAPYNYTSQNDAMCGA